MDLKEKNFREKFFIRVRLFGLKKIEYCVQTELPLTVKSSVIPAVRRFYALPKTVRFF